MIKKIILIFFFYCTKARINHYDIWIRHMIIFSISLIPSAIVICKCLKKQRKWLTYVVFAINGNFIFEWPFEWILSFECQQINFEIFAHISESSNKNKFQKIKVAWNLFLSMLRLLEKIVHLFKYSIQLFNQTWTLEKKLSILE